MGLRRIAPAALNTFTTISNLAITFTDSGDITAALALREQAAASATQELGPEHPCTQRVTGRLDELQQMMDGFPSGTRATATLVGLASKPELNGEEA